MMVPAKWEPDKLCGVRGIGQVAKLLGARAEVRLTRASESG